MITNIELAFILLFTAIVAAGEIRAHWQQIENWRERRAAHQRHIAAKDQTHE